MSRAVPLPKSCVTCRHYDGDHHCAQGYVRLLIHGYIVQPDAVVCSNHGEKDKD